ncbi:MAG: S-layer homology domain-containing protein [Clostridia bacterium]|nr:S-layer homology domain-containing protein [Clostridia bacterium]
MKRFISCLLFTTVLFLFLISNVFALDFEYTQIAQQDEWQLLSYINEFRRENGKNELTMLESLQGACNIRAKEILQNLSHYRPDSSLWYTVLDEENIIYDSDSIEIIAANYNNTADFTMAMLGSKSESEKLLSDITHIGIAYVQEEGKANKSAYCIIGITCDKYENSSLCNAEDIHIEYSQKLDKTDLTVKTECKHGDAYIPVEKHMISEYDSENMGTNKLEVNFEGFTFKFELIVDYIDSKPSEWYYDAVLYCTDKGYFTGLGNGKFDTAGEMTREMFVTVLGRFAAVDISDYTESSFADVEAGQWYSPYIEWASRYDVVKGDGKGNFNGSKAITRQEICVIINNYTEKFEVDISEVNEAAKFTDSDKIADWANSAVEYCQTRGIMKGNNKGEFMPEKTASRSEVATVFYNFDKCLK